MAYLISDVLGVATVEEWRVKIMGWASDLGLPVTNWFSGGVARTIIAIMARAMNAADGVTVGIASGGFLDTAAAVTPERGPGWLDLVAKYVFGCEREKATQGTTSIAITNTGADIGPIPVGTYHVRVISSGRTYRNSAAITIVNGTATYDLICDSFGVGDAATLLCAPITTYAGVTLSGAGLVTGAVGSLAETNAALVSRCRDKIGSFAPKLGGASSYRYFALTTSEPDYPLPNSAITRVAVSADPITGNVLVCLANSSGAPSGGDVTSMQIYLDATATPDGETMTASACTEVPVNLDMTVFCPSSYAGQLIADVSRVYAAYVAINPIGGQVLEEGDKGLSLDGFEDYLARELPYIRTQQTFFNSFDFSQTLNAFEVATVGTIAVARGGA